MNNNLSAQLSRIGETRTVNLTGEMDMASVGYLQDTLAPLIAYGDGDLALELSEVTFVDSSGIAVILSAHNHLRDSGYRLVLLNPQAAALRVLTVTGLVHYLNIEPEQLGGEQ